MEGLEKFFEQFEGWVLKDIRTLLKLEDEDGNLLDPDRTTYAHHRPFVAAVILTCCAIDVLAAFRYGRGRNRIGQTFKDFIKEYFTEENTRSGKSYNAQHVYDGLRNALIHGYSLRKYLALSHTDESKHLERADGRTMIDVFMLYYDLNLVYQKYKQELQNGSYLTEFKSRWQFAPLIQYIPEEEMKRSRG